MKRKMSSRGVIERQITEEDVLGQIRQFLELNGARVHRIVERIPWGKKTSTPGMPDLYCYFWKHPEATKTFEIPLHFWVEVKKPGGHLRPAQENWLREANNDGVIAIWADSLWMLVEKLKIHGIYLQGKF